MPDGEPRQSSGLGGTLKAKWGPLPVWGWLLAVTIILLAWYLYEQHKAGGSQTTAPMSGQPGVVVINQDGTKPPTPPEDHDKDDKGKGKKDDDGKDDDDDSKGHDHDDHHRHRKKHHKKKNAASTTSTGSGNTATMAPSPFLPAGKIVTGHQPGPANVGSLFPKISPRFGEREGSGGRIKR